MSFRDPEDKSIYQKKSLLTEQFSHGRITLEEHDKVINVRNGILELEVNNPSSHDTEERLSIVIRGGTWYLQDKKRTPKNATTFRFSSNDKNKDMMEQIAGFLTGKTQKLFFCEGRKEDVKK